MPADTKSRPETRGRPTLYKGIRMRSRLEAAYAAYLDQHQVSWEYEPECFASAAGQWLPDFRFGADPIYIELKPPALLDFRLGETGAERYARIDAILARMMIAWDSQPESRLELVFFDYDRNEPDATIAARRRSPWFVLTPSSTLYQSLWGGMGQWEALPAANPHFAEAASAR